MTPKDGLPYAYELYTRMLESVTVDGVLLKDRMLPGGWSAWECAAQLTFMVDLAGYAKTGQMSQSETVSFRALCVGAVLAAWTFLSKLFATSTRVPIIVFSVDKDSAPGIVDFRIEKLYQALNTRNDSYIEFFHTEGGLQSVWRMFRRFRPSLYLEGIDWWYHVTHLFAAPVRVDVGGLTTFTPEEARVIERIVTKYVRAEGLFSYRARAVERIIGAGAYTVVFGIDDARYYHSLAASALKFKIPFYALQHAHVTPYHIAWLQGTLTPFRAKPTHYLVWNDYWKRELVDLKSVWGEKDLIVAGSPKRGQLEKLKRGGVGAPVVIPFETEAPRDTVIALVKELASVNQRILFKLRPDKSAESQLKTLGEAQSLVEPVSVINEPVLAVLGTYSTYLYDSLAAGIPVGIVRTELRYAERLLTSGMGIPVEVGKIAEGVEKLASLSDETCSRFQSTVAPAEKFDEVLGAILNRVA